MASLLFLAAGTIKWVAAWVFVLEMVVLGLVVGVWLAGYDKNLLTERIASPIRRDQQRWDQVVVGAVYLLWAAWLVVMGLDAGRYKWSNSSISLQLMGCLCLALYMAATAAIFRENTYAVPSVRIQKNRRHRVITTGPYRLVRHPLYASSMLFYFGGALLLGSWWGVAMVPVLTTLLGIRAIMEERVLADELEDYRDYAVRVPYRLVPLVW